MFSKAVKSARAEPWLPSFSDSVLEMAAVSVVLPWSTWPMVPMLTCGLERSNFSLAMFHPPYQGFACAKVKTK